MIKGGILGNVLEGVKEELKESGKTVIEQIGVAQKKQTSKQNISLKAQDDQQKAFIRGLYGEAVPVSEEEKQKKELEDKQKTEALKQRLHSEYYQKLVHRPKAPEERPAEKVEREKKEEEFEFQQKEAKKPKLSRSAMQQRGTAELPKVVSG